jgi:hypothetical protein
VSSTTEWLNKDRSKQNTWRGGRPYSFNLYKGLLDMVHDLPLPLNKMVEIGCHKGESTELFAILFNQVYAVDPWADYKSSFGRSMTSDGVEIEFDKIAVQYRNIVKIKETSLQACSRFDYQELDFVYVDGAHDYDSVKNDITVWMSRIRKGGVIGGHDYTNIKAVKRAVDECLESPDKVFSDYSWVKHL